MELNKWNRVKAKGDFNENVEDNINEFFTDCQCYENDRPIEGYKACLTVNKTKKEMYFDIYDDSENRVYFVNRPDIGLTAFKARLIHSESNFTYIDSYINHLNINGRLFFNSHITGEEKSYFWSVLVDRDYITIKPPEVEILIEANDYKLKKHCKYIFTVSPL